MVFVPRRFPSVPHASSLLRRLFCLLSIILIGMLPGSSRADLFYKVQKVIQLTDSGLNPAADGSIP